MQMKFKISCTLTHLRAQSDFFAFSIPRGMSWILSAVGLTSKWCLAALADA